VVAVSLINEMTEKFLKGNFCRNKLILVVLPCC
jgi:hypothetical protein